MSTKEKSLGHIQNIALDIAAPMKMQVPQMSLNQICILIGQNGSGKSLILKLNWCYSMLANTFLQANKMSIACNSIENLQYILDKSFDDQDFDGVIDVVFDGMSITSKMEKGIVKDVQFLCLAPNLVPSNTPVFMSSKTRLIESQVSYLQHKKALGITSNLSSITEQETEKILESYKLYDFLFLETLLDKLNKFTPSSAFVKRLKDEFNLELAEEPITVDINACTIGNSVKNFCRYSSGEQALLTMILGTEVVNS